MFRVIIFLACLFSAVTAVSADRALVNVSKAESLFDTSVAFLVGESSYDNGWPDLPGVKDNVVMVASALATAGFEIERYSDLTAADFKGKLSHFLSKYANNSRTRVFVYFAGHGHTIEKKGKKEGYVVFKDAAMPDSDMDRFTIGSIPMSYFANVSKELKTSNLLFVFDSCFSGSIFSVMRSVPEILKELLGKPTRQFITSGTESQLVPDISIFRRELVEGIGGMADLNSDGVITGTELGQHLQDKVTEYTGGTQTPMFGKLNGYKGEFVFISRETGVKKTESKPAETGERERLLNIIKANPHSPNAEKAMARLREIDDSLKIEPPVKTPKREDRVLTASSQLIRTKDGIGYPFVIVAPVAFEAGGKMYKAAFSIKARDYQTYENLKSKRYMLINLFSDRLKTSDIKDLKDIYEIRKSARQTAFNAVDAVCHSCIFELPAIAGLMGL